MMSKTTNELREYKELFDEGVITKSEFEKKKGELLKTTNNEDTFAIKNAESVVSNPTSNRFSENERMGRGEFVAVLCAVLLITFAAIDLSEAAVEIGSSLMDVFSFTLFVLATGLELWAIVKRLHDINTTGWATLLLFVPFINMIFFIYLIFTPPVD